MKLLLPRARVQSLIRELRSHKPSGIAIKKKKEKKKKKENCEDVIFMLQNMFQTLLNKIIEVNVSYYFCMNFFVWGFKIQCYPIVRFKVNSLEPRTHFNKQLY